MRNFIFLLLSIFMQGVAFATECFPSEMLIFKLANQSPKEWKEISRSITVTNSLVERIPIDQTVENWYELILINAMCEFSFGKSAHVNFN